MHARRHGSASLLGPVRRGRPVRPARPAATAVHLGLAAILAVGLLAAAPAPPAAAGTADTMEASLLSWINRDRVARGLRPLVRDSRLADLAGDRAARLAALNVLSHSAPGNLGSQLGARSIQWYSYGENIAMTTVTWGGTAAASMYQLWKQSSGHWALMMSQRMNYLGIGVAKRSGGSEAYGSIVFTESRDHTRPAARMSGVRRSGTTVTWTWQAWDRLLQTHTAGLRDMDVQYRVGGGTWRTIRNDTTATSLTLTGRPRGYTVYLRVRSRDRVGLLSVWSQPLGVAIP